MGFLLDGFILWLLCMYLRAMQKEANIEDEVYCEKLRISSEIRRVDAI